MINLGRGRRLSRTKKIFAHELREEAAGQLGPLTMDNGLVGSWRTECQRCEGRLSGGSTAAGRVEGLPTAVDIDVNRTVAEALGDAARLVRATQCWRTVDPTADFALRIPDGHVGTGEAPRDGIGLRSRPIRTANLGVLGTIAAGMSFDTVVSIRVPVSNQAPT
jgi:hypothetical protein